MVIDWHKTVRGIISERVAGIVSC